MRGQLVGGLVAVVAAVAVSAAGAGGARASLSPGPGAQLWAARYNGPGNSGVAYSVAVGPGGRTVFVTGQSAGTDGGVDYATVAYNAATGTRRWVARYNAPANTWDAASSVAVSPTGGAVFVTGVSQGTASGLDYATVAYSAATGARLWVRRYNGPGNGDDGATSMAVSPTGGTVFVTGYSQGMAPGFGYATVAYNATTGAQRWVARYHGPGNGDNFAESLAVSPDGRSGVRHRPERDVGFAPPATRRSPTTRRPAPSGGWRVTTGPPAATMPLMRWLSARTARRFTSPA